MLKDCFLRRFRPRIWLSRYNMIQVDILISAIIIFIRGYGSLPFSHQLGRDTTLEYCWNGQGASHMNYKRSPEANYARHRSMPNWLPCQLGIRSLGNLRREKPRIVSNHSVLTPGKGLIAYGMPLRRFHMHREMLSSRAPRSTWVQAMNNLFLATFCPLPYFWSWVR
jgi:hypothetical protein